MNEEFNEKKVRSGARKIIDVLKKLQDVLEELNEKVPLSSRNGDRAMRIVLEEIDKSNLNSVMKEAMKTSVSGVFQKEPDYVR